MSIAELPLAEREASLERLERRVVAVLQTNGGRMPVLDLLQTVARDEGCTVDDAAHALGLVDTVRQHPDEPVVLLEDLED